LLVFSIKLNLYALRGQEGESIPFLDVDSWLARAGLCHRNLIFLLLRYRSGFNLYAWRGQEGESIPLLDIEERILTVTAGSQELAFAIKN
jgi:hypothetical protein